MDVSSAAPHTVGAAGKMYSGAPRSEGEQPAIEGKNCFGTRWRQEPIFSGGALASIALPQKALSVECAAKGGPTASAPCTSVTTREECLVMACGDTVNVVRAATGVVLCSYTLPVEDLILHIDAVTVQDASDFDAAMGSGDAGQATAEDSKTAAVGKAATAAKKGSHANKMPADPSGAVVKKEKGSDRGETAAAVASTSNDIGSSLTVGELAAPAGCYIAVGTRALQIYVLRVEVRVDVRDEAPASDAEPREKVDAGLVLEAPPVRFVIQPLRNWTAAQHAISVVHFSHRGTHLVAGSTDGTLRVWNVFHHHLTHNFTCAHSSLVQSVYLDANETHLAVGSFEGHVTVFDFVTKRMVAAGRPHVQAVESMTFNESLTHVYSIARDRRLAFCQFAGSEGRKSGELKEVRAIVLKEHISSAAFEDASRLHVGSMDGVVTTYSVSETGPVQVVRRLPKPPAADADDSAEEAFVRSVLVKGTPKGIRQRRLTPSSDGTQEEGTPRVETSSLYIGDAGFNVQVLVPSGTAPGQYKVQQTVVGFLDQLLDVKLFPSGSPLHRVVVTNSKDVRLFATDGCVSSQSLRGHSDTVLCCAVSSDGALIATGSKDKEVRVWSTKTFETVLRGVEGHTAELTSLCFNSKQTETYLLLFTVSSDENLRMWDVGMPLAEQAEHASSASLPTAVEMHHRSGVNAAHTGPIYTVAVAPNDQYVATGGKDKAVNVWNITGKKLYREASLRGHRRGISSLAFSPVDRVLASASNDGSVRLWSLVSLTCLKALQTDRTSVLQLGFFNSGTQIVTGNAEGVLRVWAIASSESVWSAESHTEKIWALAIEERMATQETIFYTGAADGVLIATEDYTSEEVARVKEDRHEMILQEQALANALRSGEFSHAFQLALRLSHPRHLRQVIARWCAKDTHDCERTLRGELLPSLDVESMTRLLEYTREWITNSRHCMVATLVLYVLVSSRHFEDIAQMPSMASLIEPLLAYTHKHSQRLHDLLRRTYYVDYVLRGLAPNALTTLPPFVHPEQPAAATEPSAKRIRVE